MTELSNRFVFLSWLLVVLPFMHGCGYGDVGPTTYRYAKALYSICNRKAADKLDAVSDQIASSRNRGEITVQESRWLMDIVKKGRDGKWEAGARDSRKMMEDQIE